MAPNPLFHYRVLASRRGRRATAVRRVLDMTVADPDWVDAYDNLLPTMVAVYEELFPLHVEKSATYGTEDDRFANFTITAELAEMCDEGPVLLRIIEKLVRCINMMGQGDEDDIKEWPDLASLCLVAEALRRRRSAGTGSR